MRWSPVLLLALAGLEAAHAHGEGPHAKVVLPRRGVDELRAKREAYKPWNPPTAANKPRAHPVNHLSPRQTSAANTTIAVGDNINCGGAKGSCAPGYCCSASGWCGQTAVYCASPDCQISYGPACDGNQKPSGADTSNDPRPLKGSIPYGGVGIYNCVKQGDVAITYDDGPYIYTAAMLDAFKAHGAVATWFITGNNIGKGMINVAYSDVIKRMVADGHQIASHTWSHENLDQLTRDQRKNQMVYNEIAFQSILGFYPTYMRPPYSICGSDCQAQMVELGYHITYFDLDTQGYLHTDPSQISVSVGLWDAAMLARTPCNGSYLHIEHDIHQQVATTLTNHILDSVVANGWNAVTVGTCLGDPPENWYRGSVPSYNFQITPVSAPVCGPTSTALANLVLNSTGNAVSNATSSVGLAVSVDATCGSASGQTCLGSKFGNCCSRNGYCGQDDGYCGYGCQLGFGNCTASASSSVLTALPISLTGGCGAANGNATCAGSTFGQCCSRNGWCGSGADYCGTGCQSNFGSCGQPSGSTSPSSSSTTATSSLGTTATSSLGTTSSSSSRTTSSSSSSPASSSSSSITSSSSSRTSSSSSSSITSSPSSSTTSSSSSRTSSSSSSSTTSSSSSRTSSSSSSSTTSSSSSRTSSSSSSSTTSSSSSRTSSSSSSSSSTTSAPPSARTATSAGAPCGPLANTKCGEDLCCTLLGVCAGTRLLITNNPSCFRLAGCQSNWGTCF